MQTGPAATLSKRVFQSKQWSQALQSVLRGSEDKDAIYVANLAQVRRQLSRWRSLLPMVEPHYAFKCNPDPKVADVLADAGIGFDCASKGEIQEVLDRKVSPDRVVFAHPCKSVSHLRYARESGVTQTVFDNEDELHKVKAVYPDAELILRLRTDDSKSVCQLSNKYGANMEDVPRLFDTARSLGLNVVGISYHVGSGCSDINSYAAALRSARTAFDIAASKGFHLKLLDIGGGFPGSGSDVSLRPSHAFHAAGAPSANNFVDIAAVIRKGLGEMFPASSGVRVIAEPGRYFVEGAFALCANVIARRSTVTTRADGTALDMFVPGASLVPASVTDLESAGARNYTTRHASEIEHTRYYINDSVYGSFNCVMYDHAHVTPTPLPSHIITAPLREFRQHLSAAECGPDVVPPIAGPMCDSSIWGQTCDGIDLVMKHVTMPQLKVGDWLCFENMGAYTMAAGGTFNGFETPKVVYVDDEGDVEEDVSAPVPLTHDELLERFRRRANDPTLMLP